MTDNTELLRYLDCHWHSYDEASAKAIRELEAKAITHGVSYEVFDELNNTILKLQEQVKEYYKALTEAKDATDGGDSAAFNLLRIKAMGDK